MRFSKFLTDPEAEEAGVWVEAGDGLRLRVARTNNARYRRALAEAARPNREALRGPGGPELLDRILLDVFADTVLLGWEGLEDEEGKPLPYSRAVARQCLERSRDFRDLVGSLAERQEQFRKKEAEAAGKP